MSPYKLCTVTYAKAISIFVGLTNRHSELTSGSEVVVLLRTSW